MNNKTTLLTVAILSLLTIACSEDPQRADEQCSTPATVRDFTGTDGCGFVFELNDGTYLEPVRIFECGTPPIPEEQLNDPLRDFQFVDGKKVGIDYYEENAFGSACMIGKTVRITCISEPPLPIVD